MAREAPGRTARIQARDPEIMRELVETLLPQLLRAARGAGLDAGRAEDVAQETFLTFIEKAARRGDVARGMGDPHPEDPATLKRLSRSILDHLGGNGDQAPRPRGHASDPSG